MEAWGIALADGLVEEIGEHHGLLQGVLETCLKEDYPETGAHVTSDLTTTEFSIAMLASRGWSNTEIANHLGISTGTVKNRLSMAYAKLGITSRAELTKYLLQ